MSGSTSHWALAPLFQNRRWRSLILRRTTNPNTLCRGCGISGLPLLLLVLLLSCLLVSTRSTNVPHVLLHLPLNHRLEEADTLPQLPLLRISSAQQSAERLCANELLSHYGVRLAECPDAHRSCIRLGSIDNTQGSSRVGRCGAVELEVVDVHADKVELGFEIVPEGYDVWAAFGFPRVRDTLDFAVVEKTEGELGRDVGVEERCEEELEFTIEQGLLARCERNLQGAR